MIQTQESNAETIAPPPSARILLVDDSEAVRNSLSMVLKYNGFHVTGAANVKEALRLIASQTFDVLLSDLHMPHAGDGLTVVSAMRHSNPSAVTLIFSGYPGMEEAASAILMQADEILLKPVAVNRLVDTIRERMRRDKVPPPIVESVATIVEHEGEAIIRAWLVHVDREPALNAACQGKERTSKDREGMSQESRSAHLPQLLADVIHRLRNPLPLGAHALPSSSAAMHGLTRRQQGYTAAMIVEESRLLQVSIFQTLHDNLYKVDFSVLLVGVMAIADEVDSQLAQCMASYSPEARMDVAC